MVNEQARKPDGEFRNVLIVCGIFTIALLIVDITYSNMSALFDTWLAWPFAIVHALLFVGWFITVALRDDPNYDWLRGVVIALAIIGMVIVMAHRNDWLDNKAFQSEVDKNKQEQLK